MWWTGPLLAGDVGLSVFEGNSPVPIFDLGCEIGSFVF